MEKTSSLYQRILQRYQIEAILDDRKIQQSMALLKKNKKFEDLKKSYETVKKDLIDDLALSHEEASSIINYAIHT